MEWLELTVETASPAIEPLTARMTALGYDSFVVDDENEFRRFVNENRAYWDYVDDALLERMKGLSRIRLYIEEDGDLSAGRKARELVDHLRALKKELPGVDFGPMTCRTSTIRDEDWANSWKRSFNAIPAGRGLLVVPEWLHPDNPEGRLPIRLNPGMIFGTGEHASTQLCMAALEDHVKGGEEVIDLGSGSGILSITALLLGAKHALCIDVDPAAEHIARENAGLNGLNDGRLDTRTGDVLKDRVMMDKLAGEGCDLLLANIVAGVLVDLAPIAPRLLRGGGKMICSGIIAERAGEVRGALCAAGMRIIDERADEEWRMFVAAVPV